MNKDLNYYLNLPWSFRFEWSNEDECYIASIAELHGCKSDGKTINEAVEMINDALKSYLETMIGLNKAIPEPTKPADHKGNIPFRTTSERHYKLARKAHATGKSINKLIEEAVDNLLAS